MTAYHLLRNQVQARVIVIEPRSEPGLGVAYSTTSLRHLLNVPAGKISALPNQPNHFLDWLRATHDPNATGETFAPRAIFGRYIQSLLAETKGIELVQGAVTDYHPSASGAVLTLSDGSALRADLVVLATGNFNPSPLSGISEQTSASGVYRHDAWLSDTFDNLEPNGSVMLIGTGLTSVDVLLRLRESGHRAMRNVLQFREWRSQRERRRPALPICGPSALRCKQVPNGARPSTACALRRTTSGLHSHPRSSSAFAATFSAVGMW
jgi:uncharacterized NAD(P)/FAD-binding protein YdhS